MAHVAEKGSKEMDLETNAFDETGREKRMLRTRVIILEAALAAIDEECERALDEPSVSFVSLRRVAALTRQALGPSLFQFGVGLQST